ncbi:carboxylic ester hydrolase [Streptomyces narbonensis]
MLALAPFADGELIPVPALEALTSGGAGDGVPLMLGFAEHESTMIPAPEGLPVPLVLGDLGLDAARIDAFTRAHAEGGEALLFGQALTDSIFRAPNLAVADARAAPGTAHLALRVRLALPPVMGIAFHCLDLPFAFDVLESEGVAPAAGGAPPRALADAVHRAWVAFVTDQDPGADWPRYTTDRRATRIWDTEPRIAEDPLDGVRAIWSD